ncbi:MAG: hybrid sensor histidine kinase/response regulator, partial [Planctomycetota bacterium]
FIKERKIAEEALQKQTDELSKHIQISKEAQKKALAEKKRAELYLEIAEAIIVELDSEGKILVINKRGRELLGYTSAELIGENWFDIATPEEQVDQVREVHKSIISGEMENIEYFNNEILTKEGKRRFVAWHNTSCIDDAGNITGSLSSGIDITESKKMQDQLLHSSKMDAIGQLAGGVAHDFNNQLGGILGYAEILLRRVRDKDLNRYIEFIIKAANHAAALTEKLLAFARKQHIASSTIDIHEPLNESIALLKSTIDRIVKVEVSLNADLTEVIGDPSQLQSAFLNLGINASHAMPDGGIIYIDSRNVDLDRNYCKASEFDIYPGTYIEVEIKDTGEGIPSEDLKHIFEPFFTTKKQGEGTGLGLAAVYGTVQQHKGMIEVRSVAHEGTSFHLLFPIGKAVQNEILPVTPTTIHGTGCILVIDDEEIMRFLCKEILQELGYKVLSAENGKIGVEVFEDNIDKVDLVILDMIMPEMNGRDCFNALKKIKPDLPIIISSGFSREEDIDDIKATENVPFIKKPYSLAALSQLLKSSLEE